MEKLKKPKQLKLFKDSAKAHGGELYRTRKGRSQGRPLSTQHSMHLVLRSSRARGEWSFWRKKNKGAIAAIVKKFALKYAVKVHSMANVGNHLHFHIKLSHRHTYAKFIRGLTAAIAMKVTGVNRWEPKNDKGRLKFWDLRPFTNILKGLRGFLNLKNYVAINQLEGIGFQREQARFHLAWHEIKTCEVFASSG